QLGLTGLVRAQTWNRVTSVLGLEFAHPVGLAAGLDKNADYIDPLAALGFAFIEVGTLTPKPQRGNPKPRLFRLPQERAIINRMGFNNKGIDHAVARIARRRSTVPVGVNIGKNLDTPVERAVDDYLLCYQKCYRVADYVTINVSSPNTPDLRNLQFGEYLDGLLKAMMKEQTRLQQQHNRYVPLLVKIAPDLSGDEIDAVCKSIRSHGIDGVIATNTTVSREGVSSSSHRDEAGGLSGAPLGDRATEVLARVASNLGDLVPVVAVGGIMNAADARAKILAGAALVQIYTGFIYRGPQLIADIVKGLDD
ncbi:MAG: quinone-dependent dihydroorotate dehydrogenase, partial [Gammaproteobacteria bacterium]